jgi:DNA-binding SARP family transcriptional activator
LATQILNSLNSNIKKALAGYLNGAAPILCEDGTYRLNSEAGVVVDCARFDALAEHAHRVVRSGEVAAAEIACERALAAYAGNLHTRETNEYLLQFERLRARYLGLLALCAEWRAARGEWPEVMSLAYRILSEDECREDAHRYVMRGFAAQNQRCQALRQYQLCARLLRKEFDAAPELETQALYENLRNS